MANGVLIEELKLKDTGFSSGVKSAKKSLDDLNKANNVTDNSLRKVGKEFNAARKKAMDLTAQYNELGEAAKNSDFGRKMAEQIDIAIKKAVELKKVQNEVNDTIANMSKNANTKGLDSITKAFGDIGGAVSDRVLGNMGGLGSAIGGIAKAAGGIGLAVAGVTLVGDAMIDSTKKAIEFEDSLSNLSAITGLQGQALDKLKKQIENTGNETHKSFKTIADSYTVIGSKMPELLKQPEALDAVTRSVITLAKASRMDLGGATDALTGIMNQMGASTKEADRYINVLAAGAKEGAGSIEYLATAYNKCGTSVAAAGLSIEQGTALIEILAQKIPDASTAGTNLRNILLKMMQGADEINPKIVGLNKALENLAKHTNDTTWMVKNFGSENVNAAITLAESAKKADELTNAVSGTNEAEKQAQIQTNNVAGSIKKLTTDWDNFITSLNNSTGVLKTTIDFLDKLIIGFRNAVNAKSDYEKGSDTGVSSANGLIEGKRKKYSTSDNEREAKITYAKYVNDLNKSIKTAIADRSRAQKDLRRKSELGDESGADSALKAVRAFSAQIKTLKEEAKKTKWSDFFKKEDKKTNTTTSSTTDKKKTSSKSSNKNNDMTFDEQLELARFKLTEGLINEEEELKEEISAIQARKRALEKSTDSIKKNKVELDRLTKQEKASKSRLAIVQKQNADINSINNAETEYNDTLEDIAREKQLGLITEQEYQQKYLQALQSLVKKYADANTLTDELRKKLQERKQELQYSEGSNAFAEKSVGINATSRIIKGLTEGNTPFTKILTEVEKIRETEKQLYALEHGKKTTKYIKDPDTGQYHEKTVDYSRYNNEEITKGLSLINNRPNIKTEEEIEKLIDKINEWIEKENGQVALDELVGKLQNAFPDYKKEAGNVINDDTFHDFLDKIRKDSKDYFTALKNFEDKKRTAGMIDPENRDIYKSATSPQTLSLQIDTTSEGINEKSWKITETLHDILKKESMERDAQLKTMAVILDRFENFNLDEIYKGDGKYSFDNTQLSKLAQWAGKQLAPMIVELQQKSMDFAAMGGNVNLEEIRDFIQIVNKMMKGIDDDTGKFKTILDKLLVAIRRIETTKENYSNPLKVKGDASNFNITGQTSYQQVSKNSSLNNHADKWSIKQGELDELLSRYQKAEALEMELVLKGIDTSELDEDMNDLENQIYDKAQDIQSHLDFEFRMKRFDEVTNAIGSLGNMASSIKGIGDAFENAEDGVDQFIATINALVTVMQTVQTVIELVNFVGELFTKNQEKQGAAALANAGMQAAAAQQNVASNVSETSTNIATSVSEATKQGSKLPFPYNIAAIAAGVAAVVAAIASISSIGGKFANGGIITGSGGVAGDTTLIRANVGEMVLNKRQQSNLFDLLDNGGTMGSGGQVEFKLRGADLYGSLHNYSKIKSNSGKHINL